MQDDDSFYAYGRYHEEYNIGWVIAKTLLFFFILSVLVAACVF